ncbi:hypothetical protein [Kitasatospora camelliae]|uniref:Uncharacterized protein n=1 Tax=Kitasatospora camelliae TaxID=3156397 RepID=A0AAU8K693_9ACTN
MVEQREGACAGAAAQVEDPPHRGVAGQLGEPAGQLGEVGAQHLGVQVEDLGPDVLLPTEGAGAGAVWRVPGVVVTVLVVLGVCHGSTVREPCADRIVSCV